MEEKSKRVVQIEIDDQVKKLTIEGVDTNAQVVMREELNNEELDSVAGGSFACRVLCPPIRYSCIINVKK